MSSVFIKLLDCVHIEKQLFLQRETFLMAFSRWWNWFYNNSQCLLNLNTWFLNENKVEIAVRWWVKK